MSCSFLAGEMANVYHFNCTSQPLKEKWKASKENITGTVNKKFTFLWGTTVLLKKSLMLVLALEITKTCILITQFIFPCLHYNIFRFISCHNQSVSSHPHFSFSSNATQEAWQNLQYLLIYLLTPPLFNACMLILGIYSSHPQICRQLIVSTPLLLMDIFIINIFSTDFTSVTFTFFLLMY